MDPVSLLSLLSLMALGRTLGIVVGNNMGSGGWSPGCTEISLAKEYHLQSLTIHICSVYQSYIMPHHATVKCSTGYVYRE